MHQTPRVERTGVSEESKLSAIKTLAIIGFIATAIILVWLAVVIVRFIPEGFSTLASLMESVSSPGRELQIATNRTVVHTNDSVTVSWNKTGTSGIYGFSYSCTDGVAGSMLLKDGSTTPILCDTWVALQDDVTSTEFLFTSERTRFADVTLHVRFTPESGARADLTSNVLVTIVNESIVEPGTTPEAPVVPTATTTPEVVPAPVVVTPKPVTPAYPVSNPNGFSDLQITYIGVGTYQEGSKIFTAQSSLDNDSRHALRFEVKNIGTKTSSAWNYTALLPTEYNDIYTATSQTSLLPGERAIVTVLFTPRTKTGSATIEAELTGGGDTRFSNNSFTRSITISD